MIKILKKIDKLFCTYLGLEYEAVSPNIVEVISGNVLVSNTESFKRHTYMQNWDEFSAVNLNQVNSRNREKLGIAMGKAIAKNLIISFEDIKITREQIDV